MKRTVVETIVFAASLIVILVVAIGLVADMNRKEERVADFQVEVTRIRANNESYEVFVRLTNRGRLTTEQVTLEGNVNGESSEITFDYLPSGSSDRAALRFTSDPQRYKPSFRVKSYRIP
jgi:uncharacterized protein (TIGR02588 family)